MAREPYLFVTAGLPPDLLSLVGKVNKAVARARRCAHAKRERRYRHHARCAMRVYMKLRGRISIVPMSAIEAPLPPHTEPDYN